MKLSEARRRYIGKKFRIKHAERGYYKPYVIKDAVGICKYIEAIHIGTPVNMNDLKDLPEYMMPKPMTVFNFYIDIPGHTKWFRASEIEPINK